MKERIETHEENIDAFLQSQPATVKEKLPLTIYYLSASPFDPISFDESQKFNTEQFACISFYKPISQIINKPD